MNARRQQSVWKNRTKRPKIRSPEVFTGCMHGSGYAICVYVAETALSDGETAALIAEISRLVWQRLSAE